MSPQTSSDIPETASPTPEGLIPAPRKRKRNVLSCLDCRRRKVKCDHGLPACSRCRQRGIASSCTYEYSAADDNGHHGDSAKPSDEDPPTEKASAPSSSDQSGTSFTTQIPLASTSAYLEQRDMITRLENRLNILEAAVANGHSIPCVALKAEFQGSVPRQPEANFFKGRGYRTQFYGASCPNSVLASVCLMFR
jgi:hypothetical protein